MDIQQAIFTSLDRSQVRGYQLVACSDGIDRNIARELHRWSPSSMVSDAPADWTINFYPVCQDYVAVARTAIGGPEYSNRGASQVVTITAILHNRQFAAYDNNAVLFASTALSLGWLRIPEEMPRQLDTFQVPSIPLASSLGFAKSVQPDVAPLGETTSGRADNSSLAMSSKISAEISEQLVNRQRVAIVGAQSPIELIASLISSIPHEKRREVSFTTGLPPAPHRPFQAHFLRQTNPVLSQMLKSAGINVIPFSP